MKVILNSSLTLTHSLILVFFFLSQFNVTLSSQCEITNVFAEAYPCENGEIYVDVEYQSEPELDSISIAGNGNYYGAFEAGLPFYTIGPVPSDCNTEIQIIVSAAFIPNCVGEFIFDELLCCEEEEDECGYYNFETTEITCLETGDTQFELDFDTVGISSPVFELFVGDVAYGIYPLDNLPLTINIPYQAQGSVITVVDNDNPGCNSSFTFSHPICEIEECHIGEFFAEFHECETLDSVLIDFEFLYSPGVSNTFSVLLNSDTIAGPLTYGQLYYTVESIAHDCSIDNVLTIVDNMISDCDNAEFILGNPSCCETDDECSISEIEIFNLECDGLVYHVSIGFDAINPTNDFFDVYIEGEYFDSYLYNDLPITLNDLTVPDNGGTLITVCDNDNPDECCMVVEFEVDCEPNEADCVIFDVIAEAYDCDEGGNTFYVDVAFEYSGMVSDSFTISGYEIVYGTFAYGESYYTVGPIESTCNFDYEFIVMDSQELCETNSAGLGSPCCGGEEECSIYNLEFFEPECDGPVYHVFINFEAVNPTNDFFDVFIDGEYFDSYHYSDLPVSLNGVAVPDDGDNIITVCDNDNPNECCVSVDFEVPCEGGESDCIIFDLIAEAYDCDEGGNTFYVDVAFEYTGMPSDSFTIRGNGVIYGTFAYGEAYYTVGPIESDCNLDYEFIILDNLQECESDFAGIVSPCCEDEVDCSFSDLELFELDCDGPVYHVSINFEAVNPTNDFFDIYIDGDYFDSYLYSDLPVRLNGVSVPDDGDTFITVCDNDNPIECCVSLEFEVPCDGGDGVDCPQWEVSLEETPSGLTTLTIQPLDWEGSYTISTADGLVGESSYSTAFTLALDADEGIELKLQDINNPECCFSFNIEGENPSTGIDELEQVGIHLIMKSSKVNTWSEVEHQLAVYTIAGQQVYNSSPQLAHQSQQLPDGIYLVEIRLEQRRITQLISISN